MAARIESNADLSKLNTLGVPSRAEYLVRCKNVEEVREAITWARNKRCHVRVLSGGSNVLLNEHVDGLIIKPEFMGIEAKETPTNDVEKNDKQLVAVGAGENWHDLVMWASSHNYNGIENLALIPGSVGAAPIQNIGAYGTEVSQVISHVECINLVNGEQVTMSNRQCEFSYRHSFFKSEKGKHFLIYRVHFALNKFFRPNVSYPALSSAFEKTPPASAMDVAKKVEQIRREKLPNPGSIPNAGSFFKNPVIAMNVFLELKKRFPNVVAFDTHQQTKKLAAAWLIDQRGWKSRPIAGVNVHETQALVIVNRNRKSIVAVLELAQAIQQDIREHFGVELEIEPQFLHGISV